MSGADLTPEQRATLSDALARTAPVSAMGDIWSQQADRLAPTIAAMLNAARDEQRENDHVSGLSDDLSAESRAQLRERLRSARADADAPIPLLSDHDVEYLAFHLAPVLASLVADAVRAAGADALREAADAFDPMIAPLPTPRVRAWLRGRADALSRPTDEGGAQ